MEKDESYSSFAFKQRNNQTMISHSSKEKIMDLKKCRVYRC